MTVTGQILMAIHTLRRYSSSSSFVPGFCLLPGLGLGLSFQLHPRGVFAAGLPFGLLCRDTLRCLVRSG